MHAVERALSYLSSAHTMSSLPSATVSVPRPAPGLRWAAPCLLLAGLCQPLATQAALPPPATLPALTAPQTAPLHAPAQILSPHPGDCTAGKVLSFVAHPDDEDGRGLQLVASATRRWGTRPGEAGKTVWFELALPH